MPVYPLPIKTLITRRPKLRLLRLVQGQTVPEISTAEHLTMHQVAKCVRALYRKMAWDLRTSELSLQLV